MKFYPLSHEASIEDINKFNYSNKKIGVIIHIENAEGQILLQQRGPKSSGKNGLYEDIGGKVEEKDATYKHAILRELKEEAGKNINLEMSQSIGIFQCQQSNINWLFIIYFAKYIGGEIKIMEPEKCLDYRFFSYEEALASNLVTEECKYLIKSVKRRVNYETI